MSLHNYDELPEAKKPTFSVRSLIILGVALIALVSGIRDVRYYLGSEDVVVENLADAKRLGDNQYVEIKLKFDFDNALVLEFVGGDSVVLIPFQKSGYQLMCAFVGPLSDKSSENITTPIFGRSVAESFTEEWDVLDKRLKLTKLFRRDNISLPKNAIVVYDYPRQMPHPWHLCLLFASIVYLIYTIFKLVNLLLYYHSRKLTN